MSESETTTTPMVFAGDAQSDTKIDNSTVENVSPVRTDAVTAGNEHSVHGRVCADQKFRRVVVPVASIILGETFGRELDQDYVSMLAAIVERYGLRHPITVTADLRLLAGHPWLAAVQRFGSPMVEVVMVEVAP